MIKLISYGLMLVLTKLVLSTSLIILISSFVEKCVYILSTSKETNSMSSSNVISRISQFCLIVSYAEVAGNGNILFQYITETCFANIYAGALCRFTTGLIETFCLRIFRRHTRSWVALKIPYFHLYSFVLSFPSHGATAHSGAGPPHYRRFTFPPS